MTAAATLPVDRRGAFLQTVASLLDRDKFREADKLGPWGGSAAPRQRGLRPVDARLTVSAHSGHRAVTTRLGPLGAVRMSFELLSPVTGRGRLQPGKLGLERTSNGNPLGSSLL